MSGGDECWDRTRTSPFSWVTVLIRYALVLRGLLALEEYGQQTLNLRFVLTPLVFALVVLFGQLAVTTVHELGHGIIALAIGFRFQSINIGPLTVLKYPGGHRHYQFHWARLFGCGGYWGATPVSENHVRSNQIQVVLAGPLASLLSGLVLWLVVLPLPGSHWELAWDSIGLLSLLFLADFVANLIPIGYSDGTMLFHLLFWTQKGQDLCKQIQTSKTHSDAQQKHWEGDFERQVELQKQALEQTLARGTQNPVALAQAYQALGLAQVNACMRIDAVESLNKSLELLKSCSDAHPLLEGNTWSGLFQVHRYARRTSEAMHAHECACFGFDRAKMKHPAHLVELQTTLAALHCNAAQFERALPEIEQALSATPGSQKYLLNRARLLCLRAECEFHLGRPQAGVESAVEAARLLTSNQVADKDRVRAAFHLAGVASALWMAGLGDQAAALFFTSARRLEECGLKNAAARCDIQRALVLRKTGRLAESEEALPSQESMQGRPLLDLLENRAETRRRLGRLDEAQADLEEALQAAKETARPEETTIAMFEGLLAEVEFNQGRAEEAEARAKRACVVLCEARDPEAAVSLVTLALIALQGLPEPAEHQDAKRYLDQAFQLLEGDPLLLDAIKARALEELAARLEQSGRNGCAQEWRTAADAHWRRLQQPSVPEQIFV